MGILYDNLDAMYCSKCGVAMADTARFCNTCGSPNDIQAVAPAVTPGAAVATAPVAGVVSGPIAYAGYGGFWIRVVASIIDALVVGAGGVVFGLLLGPFAIPVNLALGWLYEAIMLSSEYQATLGKIVLNMRVTDLMGNRLTFARATGRHFAKILSAMVLFVGYIMVAFTDRNQGLHDMIAGTLVMRKNV